MTAQQYSPISLLALWEQHYQERGCFANFCYRTENMG
jgi:hypothetical protein